MRLPHETLISYRGFHGIDGLCHVRVFEAPGRLPVVIAGALDDNTGTSITNAVEMVAAAIKQKLFPEGREFELIEHYPGSLRDGSKPSFTRVRFQHPHRADRPPACGTVLLTDGTDAAVSEGPAMPGDFRSPR